MEAVLTQKLFVTLFSAFNKYFFAFHSSFMESFGLFFRSIFVLYLVCTGYNYWFNPDRTSVYNQVKTFLLVAIFYSFVLETNIYMDYVYFPCVEFVNDVAAFFMHKSDSNSVFKAVDNLLIEFNTKVDALKPKGGWDFLEGLLAGIAFLIVYLVFTFMIILFAAIYLISFFSMCLFLFLGGAFILLAAMDRTRPIFWAWFKHVCQFALTIILASVVFGISSHGILTAFDLVEKIDTNNAFSVYFLSFLIWCGVTIALFKKAPEWAGGLTNTVAGNTGDISSSMARLVTGGVAMAKGAAIFNGGGAAATAAGQAGMSGGQNGMSTLETLKKMRGIK